MGRLPESETSTKRPCQGRQLGGVYGLDQLMRLTTPSPVNGAHQKKDGRDPLIAMPGEGKRHSGGRLWLDGSGTPDLRRFDGSTVRTGIASVWDRVASASRALLVLART